MSLELQGSVTATIQSFGVRADNSNDGKTAKVQVELDLTEAEVAGLGDREFARACFNDYVGQSAATGVVRKKLGRELAIKEEHLVHFEDYPITLKPEILWCDLSKNDRRVALTIRFAIPGSAKKLRTMLQESCGDDITVVFKGVVQQDVEAQAKRMSFDQGKGNGAAPAPSDDQDEAPPPAA